MERCRKATDTVMVVVATRTTAWTKHDERPWTMKSIYGYSPTFIFSQCTKAKCWARSYTFFFSFTCPLIKQKVFTRELHVPTTYTNQATTTLNYILHHVLRTTRLIYFCLEIQCTFMEQFIYDNKIKIKHFLGKKRVLLVDRIQLSRSHLVFQDF